MLLQWNWFQALSFSLKSFHVHVIMYSDILFGLCDMLSVLIVFDCNDNTVIMTKLWLKVKEDVEGTKSDFKCTAVSVIISLISLTFLSNIFNFEQRQAVIWNSLWKWKKKQHISKNFKVHLLTRLALQCENSNPATKKQTNQSQRKLRVMDW